MRREDCPCTGSVACQRFLRQCKYKSTEMSVFHDEIEIEDFEYDEDTDTYYYPCPCGDRFAITKVSLRNCGSVD